ncbi:mono/diheme cytochrome c family protein [Methanohalophilus levihalophilus]|uniref:multiheme c-type cytochrome n=1 Tax=Methanohalophilus levihalophilus TaxID=1431282 RepID=UPI001AE713A7|nr:multiheme c-type cytochrome [Methanohalophilus levihalophilus]MBP2031115.1 mono/diheme cytochrome c family protein [Methanohalophilus levihalophilus]
MLSKNPVVLLSITIIFLVLVLPATALPSSHGEFTSDEFTEYSKCGQCHAIIRSEWDGSMHANAFTDPFYQEELKLASEDSDGALDLFCTRCHIPVGVLSAEVPPIDGSQASDVALEAVSCDFCHTVSDNDGTGNGAFISSPGTTKYGPFDDSESAFHGSEYLELYQQAEYCGMCHQVYHPANGLVLDDTYMAWEEGPYSERDVTCQDCHMTPGITDFEANPGRAGSGAPKRDHISTHYFSGANVFVTGILDEEDTIELNTERLQKAATVEVAIPETAEAGETVNMEVSITNSGAGHNIPTGLIEARQIWLEVLVSDASGTVLLDSGSLDSEGNIQNAVVYQTKFADSDGEPTFKLWEAASVISDNRISPEDTAIEEFSFEVPENVADPISVDVKLLYRSAPQSMIDDIFGDNVHEVPVVEMNSYRGAINGDVPSESTPGFGVAGMILSLMGAILYLRYGKKEE